MTPRATSVGGCALACAALGAALIAAPVAAGAQEILLPSTSWAVGPTVTMWRFATPLVQTGGGITSVSELAVPFGVRAVTGRWTFDVRGAVASSRVQLDDDGVTRTVTLSGLTDVRIRAGVPLVGEGVLLTASVNIPTGKTHLDADETMVLQTIGAPGLSLPVAGYGVGFGGTLGVVGAREVGAWAMALGGSVEQRTEYTPIELALEEGGNAITVTPGLAGHVTLGADRIVGGGRLSLLFVADAFTREDARASTQDGGFIRTSYKLGPQFSGAMRMDLATPGWRESSFGAGARRRLPFSDATGLAVEGSGATYMEASIGGVRGGSSGAGLLVAADARWQSGMTVTDALVGVAMAAAGVTVGAEMLGARMRTRVSVRGQYGRFDTGVSKSSAVGVSLGLMVSQRIGR